MMKSNSLANRILALALTLVMVLGMLPSGFTSADAVSAGLMVYIDPLDEWIEKGYTLKVWSGSDVRLPTDDNGDGIYNFQLPSGWTVFELRVSDEESGYDYIYYTNNIEIPTDDRNLYTAESVEMVTEVLGEITGTWSVYTPQSYTTVYFKPLQEWINAGYRFNFSETVNADLHFFTDSDGDGIYEVSLDSELVDRWRDGSYLHIQVREAGEDGWFSYKYYAQVKMPNDGSNLFTATALDEVYQREIIGTWSVYTPAGTPPAETCVAEVNGTKYETLAAAVAAAAPGETVKLLGNASGAGVVINKDITIDFGGFTYTFTEGVGSTGTESNGFQILAGNTVTLTNGTLNVADGSADKFYTLIQNYANLTVTDMTLDGTNLDKWAFTDGDSYTLSINSGNVVIRNTAIIANNDGDKAYAFDVCDHASYAGAPSVTFVSGTVDGNVDVSAIGASTFTIEGGSFGDTALIGYVAEGKTMDENGNVLVDTVLDSERELLAAVAAGGEVTLGGDITLTAPLTVEGDVVLNLNGYTLTLPEHDNYAIVVKGDLTVNGEGNVIVNGLYGIGLSTTCTGGLTVNGGNITGANADYLIGAFNGKVTINGGNLTAAYCVLNSFDGYNATAEVKGGTLSAEYPVLGVNVAVSDAAALNIGDFLCVNGDNYYNDLATAIADAASGDKIILLADGEGPGAVIDKKLEIDFDGHTYLFTEGVGSKGTESNGFQILAGSNVILESGKLGVAAASKDQFYILVQNYGDLYLVDMILDGTNLDKWSGTDGDSYTLSINSGDVAVGFTTIIANDQGDKAYAFDVCDHPSYEGAPSVDVHGISQIEGKVDLTAFGDSNLHTQDSDFYGEVDISKLTEDSDVEFDEGCTFVNDISAYVAEDMAAVYEGGKYVVKIAQQNFGFASGDAEIPYTEGLTYENAASGGNGDGKVTYTVTGDQNAEIDEETGKLTISGVGTYTVTATKEGNGEYAPVSASYTLTVVKGASSIKVEDVTLTFGVSEYTNPVEIVGSDKVAYTIKENDKGVTINPATGKLSFNTAVDQTGTYTVTVTVADSDNYNGCSATYTVTLNYAKTPENAYTVTGTEGANGWYTDTVRIHAATGYKVGTVDPADGKIKFYDHIAYGEDRDYGEIEIYIKDSNGNITAPLSVGEIKVDKTAPTLTVTYLKGVFKTIAEKLFFVNNIGDNVEIQVDFSDATSDVQTVLFSIDGGEKFNELNAEDVAKGTFIIAVNPERRDYIVIQVVDKAGNKSEAVTDREIIVDHTNPELSIAVQNADAESKDAQGNVIYFDSGKEFSVEYTVTENNLDLSNMLMITGSEKFDAALTDGKYTLDIAALENANGYYFFTASYADVAGNAAKDVTVMYYIDGDASTISWQNLPEYQDGKGVYYTQAGQYELKFTVNEDLFDVYKNHNVLPEVTVTVDGKSEKQELSWNTNQESLTFTEENVYEVTVTYENPVHGKVSETVTVVVDHTAPVITVEPVYDQLVDEIYYTDDTNYSLNISLTEELYDYYHGLGYKPSVTVNGEAVDLGWDEPEAVLNLPDDGKYEITVSYKTEVSEVITESVTIVVDHEEPFITMEPVYDVFEDGVYYTDDTNYILNIKLDEALYGHYNGECGLKPVITVQKDGKDYTHNELNLSATEYALELPEEGVYDITVAFANYLHEAETKTVRIVVDHAAPSITMEPVYDVFEDGVYYTDDTNYILNIKLDEALYGHYNGECGLKPVITVQKDGKDYTHNELNLSGTEYALELPEEGVYDITVAFANYLHEAETKSVRIVVDHEKPVITLHDGFAEDDDRIVNGVHYTADESYTLPITLDESLYYYYNGERNITPKITVTCDGETYEFEPDLSKTEYELPLTKDGVYVITVAFSNPLHTADTETITICRDTVNPEVSIEYRGAENKGENHEGETVFAEAVNAVIVVKDVNFDNRNKFVNLVVTPANSVEENNYNGKLDGIWTKVEGTDDTWECVLPLDQAADYVITVDCQDFANRTGSAAAKLAVDIGEEPDQYTYTYTEPVAQKILEVLSLGFYNSNLTVTVTIQDDISGVNHAKVNYTVAEDAYQEGNVGGEYEFKASKSAEDSADVKEIKHIEGTNNYEIVFTIPKEALNKDNQFNGFITVVATDYAGNDSSNTTQHQLIVDNINPTRNVTETDPVNVVDDVKYFDGDIVIRANIFDANYGFHPNAVTTIYKDGQPYQAPGWYNNTTTANNTITLTEDGDYVVTITYTDGSGNKMIDYSSGNMTLDTVAPVITVSNIKQDSANKDETYGFTITVHDINLDVDTVKPVLEAVVRGEDGLYSTVEIDLGTAAVSDDKQTVTYTVENLEEDALYKLTCSAEDMSDNLCDVIVLDDGKSYETVEFSINRNGSTYGFGSEYMTNLVNQYYVYAVYEDLIIEEVNVDPIEDYVVTVNGKELVEGTDYTTTQETKEGQWSKRTYIISKDYFADEGEYNVIVSSTDKAQTTAYSDIKDLAIAFVVDQTAPILTISGLQTGGRYQTDEQTVTLIATDEGGRLNSLKVVVMDSDGAPITDENGNDVSVRFDISGEELLDYLAENGDMVTFTIPSGLEQQVQIVCTDCAVNEYGTTNEYNSTFNRVTVSQNALVIFYANKGAFYGTIGGAAALILLIILLLKKKKNGKK